MQKIKAANTLRPSAPVERRARRGDIMNDDSSNEELKNDKILVEIMALVDHYASFVNPDLSGWKDKQVAIISATESRKYARILLINKLREHISPNAELRCASND